MGFLDRLRLSRGGGPAPELIPALSSEVVEVVDRLVRLGFHRPEDVLQMVLEAAEDESEAVQPSTVAAVVERAWSERLREQRTWPAITDADRLAAAFAELDADGILARMNFTCCQTCALEAIADEVPPDESRRGFVYFHGQDAERLLDPDPSLYLGYGEFGAVDAASHDAGMLAVAEQVRDTVDRHGLHMEWDGSIARRLCVTGLRWQRRLPD